ncbi:MAG TPA: SGNH/GDSL hydrolase family protein [Ignavibacteriaceae bacterium]|nr:SGNH/GDSL hydrolase family protein [Ignavibacteriaceae bacterium]
MKLYKRESFIINIALLFSSVIILFIICELYLSYFHPEYNSIYQPDKKLLFRLVPDGKKIYRRIPVNGGQKIQIRINDSGFRGKEIEKIKKKRIMVYGDSFIEGEFSELKNTFCERLKFEINNASKQYIEVINAGVVGYGPDQSLLKLEEDYEKYKPDIVIFSIYAGNDFGDLIRNKIFSYASIKSSSKINYADKKKYLSLTETKKKYDQNQDSSLLSNTNNYYLKESLRVCLDNNAYPGGIRKFNLVRYIERKLNLNSCNDYNYNGINGSNYVDWSLGVCNDEFKDYVSGDNIVKNLFNDHYDADISLSPESKSARYKINLMYIVLNNLYHFSKIKDLRTLVLIIPPKIDLYQDGYFKLNKSIYPKFNSIRLSKLAEEIAVLNHLNCLNLYSFFKTDNPLEFYFNGSNDHWNDRGQDYAARLTTNLILNLFSDNR